MGMFDELRVEARLPDPEYQDRTWQTKSLDCCLINYVITPAGRLIELVREGVYIEDSTALLGGYFQRTGTREVLHPDFHGDIIFYDLLEEENDALHTINDRPSTVGVPKPNGTQTPITRTMVYYKARFTDGWLQWIRRVDKEEADREP